MIKKKSSKIWNIVWKFSTYFYGNYDDHCRVFVLGLLWKLYVKWMVYLGGWYHFHLVAMMHAMQMVYWIANLSHILVFSSNCNYILHFVDPKFVFLAVDLAAFLFLFLSFCWRFGTFFYLAVQSLSFSFDALLFVFT